MNKAVTWQGDYPIPEWVVEEAQKKPIKIWVNEESKGYISTGKTSKHPDWGPLWTECEVEDLDAVLDELEARRNTDIIDYDQLAQVTEESLKYRDMLIKINEWWIGGDVRIAELEAMFEEVATWK